MSRLSGWPVLVLSAGLGTRIHPLSLVRAKPALPVAGEVLIARILRRLRSFGIEQVVVNLHHLAATITRVVGDGSAFGLQVRYSWEPAILGSAGGPARAIPLLEADRFLIVNGDTMADVDLDALASTHLASDALVTMAVVEGDSRYGGVVADREGIVQGFVRPGTPPTGPARLASPRHFVGSQAVNASAFSGVDPNAPLETVRELYPRLIAERPGSVRIYSTDAEFLDIGTPDGYLHTASHLAMREGKPLDRGARCSIAPDARVERTILWDDVTVESGASLVECVVADGVTVPAGAAYRRSSLVMANGRILAEPF
jgi:NDP-sugar pyrophosphorylase family protein